MRLASLLLVASLLVVACAGGERRPGEPHWIPANHTVQPGETLYAISWQYGLDYRQVADWNRIDAHRIRPGQRIRLYPPAGREHELTLAQRDGSGSSVSGSPGAASAPSGAAPQTAPSASRSETAPRPAPRSVGAAPTAAPRPSRPAVSAPVSSPITWQWPLQGELLSTYSSSNSGRRGVRIAANSGQPVYAAAQGRVVYSGGGLIGYGRLVIIKHNDTFLSAYAHNRTLLVQEGESVTAGQQIAEVGSTGATERALLYFEIRQDGQPVDPQLHLPKRKD